MRIFSCLSLLVFVGFRGVVNFAPIVTMAPQQLSGLVGRQIVRFDDMLYFRVLSLQGAAARLPGRSIATLSKSSHRRKPPTVAKLTSEW
ncbi:hypothetical protein MPLB_1870024 [Mesorhizobium sp. ORS 3324]|nr:hypothetical protein MPLB_1870024 [Mesorhizobium sp. ORS 3324]